MFGDHFTRWFEAVPLQDIKADTICSTFLDQWVTRFGVLEYIHSDNGSQFTSRASFSRYVQLAAINQLKIYSVPLAR